MGSRGQTWLAAFLVLGGISRIWAEESQVAPLPPLLKETVKSSLDEHQQPIVYWAPDGAKTKATPLLVLLHTWGGDFQQKHDDWQAEAVARGWLYVQPHFRGPNKQPQALGSKFARKDVLDAVDHMQRQFKVDTTRIYLAGVSGGGHMTMLMAGHHPDRFSAASSWVGISDVAAWYQFHTRDGQPDGYAKNILDCLKGPPGTDATRDADYRDRSPLSCLDRVGDLPVDIAAGIFDGHKGSVPVSHSLLAFNVIAKSHGSPLIPENVQQQLWEAGKETKPAAIDTVSDPTYSREILLRRISRQSRVTIFVGGHEGLPKSACAWLNSHQRATR